MYSLKKFKHLDNNYVLVELNDKVKNNFLSSFLIGIDNKFLKLDNADLNESTKYYKDKLNDKVMEKFDGKKFNKLNKKHLTYLADLCKMNLVIFDLDKLDLKFSTDLDKRNKTVYLFKHGKKEYLLMKQNLRGMVSKLPVGIYEQFGGVDDNDDDNDAMNYTSVTSPAHSQGSQGSQDSQGSQASRDSMINHPPSSLQQEKNMKDVDEMLLYLEREEQLEQIILLNQFANEYANEYETIKGGALSGGDEITEEAIEHITYINQKLESVNCDMVNKENGENCVAVNNEDKKELEIIDNFIEKQRKDFENKEDEKKLWINVRFLLNHINPDGDVIGEEDEPMNQGVSEDQDYLLMRL